MNIVSLSDNTFDQSMVESNNKSNNVMNFIASLVIGIILAITAALAIGAALNLIIPKVSLTEKADLSLLLLYGQNYYLVLTCKYDFPNFMH